MDSEKFRQQLQQEATQWRTDGLISSEIYDQLAERYDFVSIDSQARDRFVAVLVIIGGVLLGISVITFVAANWQVIPRSIKVVLLLSVLTAFNVAGFYLWRSPLSSASNGLRRRAQWRHRLGHGFLVCGALCLGANIALMGQLFHQQGTEFGFCLIWGLGVAAMAYSLRLTSLAMISLGLILIGYWLNVYEIYRLTGLFRFLFDLTPVIIGLIFIPLAYWCRSRAVFGLTVIGVGFTFALTLNSLTDIIADPFGVMVAIALTLPAALWWAYDDTIWRSPLARILPNSRPSSGENEVMNADASADLEQEIIMFRPIGRSLSIVYLGCLFYVLSFHYLWPSYAPVSSEAQADVLDIILALATNLNMVILSAATLFFWIWLGWPRIGQQWRLVSTDIVVLLILVVTASVTVWDAAIAPLPILATFIFNVLLFLIAVGLMREGLTDGRRRQFWFGLILLILQIISRVFEYETGLLLKSFTFLLCGVGVIVIGLWFERYVRSLNVEPSAPLPLNNIGRNR
ncbi:MAG: DUF2157 domain-containing protein [Cyanobacteria bacterium J06633_2]